MNKLNLSGMQWLLIGLIAFSAIMLYTGESLKLNAAIGGKAEEKDTITCGVNVVNAIGLDSKIFGSPDCTVVPSSFGDCVRIFSDNQLSFFSDELSLRFNVDGQNVRSESFSVSEFAGVGIPAPGQETITIQAKCVLRVSPHQLSFVLSEEGRVVDTKEASI